MRLGHASLTTVRSDALENQGIFYPLSSLFYDFIENENELN